MLSHLLIAFRNRLHRVSRKQGTKKKSSPYILSISRLSSSRSFHFPFRITMAHGGILAMRSVVQEKAFFLQLSAFINTRTNHLSGWEQTYLPLAIRDRPSFLFSSICLFLGNYGAPFLTLERFRVIYHRKMKKIDETNSNALFVPVVTFTVSWQISE